MGAIEDAYKFIQEQPLVQAFTEATDAVNKYKKRASENLKNTLGAKAQGLEAPKTTEQEKSERSTSRRILREIKRYEATGRISGFLQRELDKQQQQNESSNSAPDSSVYQNPPQNAPATITPSPSSFFPTLRTTPPSILNLTPSPSAPAPCVGLGLYTKDSGVWVGAGTIASQLPSGFDPEDGKSVASGGSGYAWAKVEIDEETGGIDSVDVDGGSSVPDNTDTKFHYTLGYYEFGNDAISVTNYGCGSIDVTVCRNWFAAEAPFYGVTINRCGCGGGY
jgi:hypothetical protein